QLAAGGLGQDPAAQPGADQVELSFGHGALRPSRSLSLKLHGSYSPSSSRISVLLNAQICSSRCQSALLRASREHSRPSTIPALPSDTSATRCWKPSRS